MARRQRVFFATAEEFRLEHTANLVNGGVFVETQRSFEAREAVSVELVLDFCGKRVELEGEVVHIVPPEMAGAGGRPGIAVQFLGAAEEVKRRLAPLAAACSAPSDPPHSDSGRRASPRVAARVPVRLDGSDGEVAGTTRNLSQTGVLVAVDSGEIGCGQRVSVQIEHPVSGEVMAVAGNVVREVETGGDVAAVGIAFDPPAERRAEVADFVEQVQSAEHTRRLGGISGPLADLGPHSLLQMFGNVAPAGTLVLRNGEDEGVIGFEKKLLRFARLGRATGMKALVRLLSWREGAFEFFTRLEPAEATEAPLPLEAALLEAVRRIDEGSRIDRSRLPMAARVVLDASADAPELGQEPFSKIEEAVLDLARAGFTLQRIVDVIPEADPEVLRALESLADRGIVRFDD